MGRPQPPAGLPRAGWIYRFAAWAGITVMRVQRWRFDVIGLEHVPPRSGFLLVANHTSFWDFFATGMPIYERFGRPVRILAKKSLFDLALFGRLLYRTGCIPVDRGDGAAALDAAVEALERGEIVLVMPEGTISRSFDLLTFRTGAARMAFVAGVPIVPAISWGTHRFYTSGRRPRWSWRLPVSIRYGEPVVASADAEATTAILRSGMRRMLDDTVDSYADGAAPGAWWVPHRLGGGAPDHAAIEAEHEETRRRWRSQRRPG
jgi:1-acyl-sn-glycerol-3-phosphate acyltransferase